MSVELRDLAWSKITVERRATHETGSGTGAEIGASKNSDDLVPGDDQ